MPQFLSQEAQLLLRALFKRNPQNRLGRLCGIIWKIDLLRIDRFARTIPFGRSTRLIIFLRAISIKLIKKCVWLYLRESIIKIMRYCK